MEGGGMSMTPHERLEHALAIETLSAALTESKKQLRIARERIARLEIQLLREGWTQDDLDDVEPRLE
jgi:hypothetical protein